MKPRKKAHPTAERILAATLALYNRFGEANVSTGLISSELGISPGNLYYHFPAKEELTNALLERYMRTVEPLAQTAAEVSSLEDAWFLLHTWLEHIRDYRFIYRDISDLISRNRHLEQQFRHLLDRKQQAMLGMVSGLERHGVIDISGSERERLSGQLVFTINYWLNFEYALQPRLDEQPEHAQQCLVRGAWQLLGLLAPYVRSDARQELDRLMQLYRLQASPPR